MLFLIKANKFATVRITSLSLGDPWLGVTAKQKLKGFAPLLLTPFTRK
jgi:hypothetical protein